MKWLTLAFIVKPNSQWNNWHLPFEIITGDIIYNHNSSISEFSVYIPLQVFAMTALGIIPVIQIGNKDWAIFPEVKYAIRGRAERFTSPKS